MHQYSVLFNITSALMYKELPCGNFL